MFPETDEVPADFQAAMHAFIGDSLRHILRHEDAEAYLSASGGLLRRAGLDAWFDAEMPTWWLGRVLWNTVPLPSRGYRPAPLPAPARNDPCPCASGKKFKRCCQPLIESFPDIAEFSALPLVPAAMTQKQRQAALKEAPAALRLAIATHELEEARPGKARNVALAVLESPGVSQEEQVEALMLLGEAYEALGHEAAGERKLRALLPRLKGRASGVARQWLAARQFERRRPDLALEEVLQALEAAPGEPVSGMLLVTALRGLGEDAVAQEVAEEWLGIVEAHGDERLVDFFREQAALGSLAEGDYMAGGELAWLGEALEAALAAPLLPVGFEEGPEEPEWPGDTWMLTHDEAVEAAEQAFHAQASGPFQEPEPLDPGLLEGYPALLQSPSYLETLNAALADRGQEAPRLLARQWQRLIEHVLAALPEGGRLPWAWLPHRPLLRGMLEQAMDAEAVEETLVGLQRLLRLCPNDNLGVRSVLINALLWEGRDEAALEVAGRYPDDLFAETQFGRVLALWRLGRVSEAEEALGEAHRQLPKVLGYLSAPTRKAPPVSPHGMTIGGADQAWDYREQMRPLFAATPGMIAWLQRMRRRLPAKA